MKRFWIAALLFTSACGPSAADVAASTEHCGTQWVDEKTLIRVSQYSAGVPSTDIKVVQACHPQRGCSPLVSTRSAMGPVLSRTANGGLVLEFLGGTVVKQHRSTIWIGDVQKPVEIRRMGAGPSAEGLNQFRARMGLPPGRTFYAQCDPALDLRASVAMTPLIEPPQTPESKASS